MTHQEKLRLIKLGHLPKECVPKKKKPIRKIGLKKQEQMKLATGDDALDLFFEAMRKKLRGKCFFCQDQTLWENEELWRTAIAHLLPKAKFESVATNEDNWIELCLSCHRSFDDGNITWELLHDSKEWEILKEKLLNILPLVPTEERKNKLFYKLEKLLYPNHPATSLQ